MRVTISSTFATVACSLLVQAAAADDLDGKPDCMALMGPTIPAIESATPADIIACQAAGVDLTGVDSYGKPLINSFAFFNEDGEVIRALVAAGADPNGQDNEGQTPLHQAAFFGKSVDVVNALLTEGADPNAKGRFGRTPLHDAGLNRNVAIAEALLTAGADPHVRGHYGRTPVHQAASNKNPKVLLALLDAGADPTATTANGETPLHHVHHAANATLLLALGNDVKAVTSHGQTALHYAAQFAQDVEVIDILINAGADIGTRDAAGRTPVHHFALRVAVDGHQTEETEAMLAALVRHGAGINSLDANGDAPLQLALASASGFRFPSAVVVALRRAGVPGLGGRDRRQGDMAGDGRGTIQHHEQALDPAIVASTETPLPNEEPERFDWSSWSDWQALEAVAIRRDGESVAGWRTSRQLPDFDSVIATAVITPTEYGVACLLGYAQLKPYGEGHLSGVWRKEMPMGSLARVSTFSALPQAFHGCRSAVDERLTRDAGRLSTRSPIAR